MDADAKPRCSLGAPQRPCYACRTHSNGRVWGFQVDVLHVHISMVGRIAIAKQLLLSLTLKQSG